MGIKDFFKGLFPEKQLSRASKGTIRDSVSYNTLPGRKSGSATPSKENLNVVLDLYSKDPVVQAAITTRVDAILSSGYHLIGSSTPRKDAEKILEKVGFNYSFLWKVITNSLLYEHVFIEIERRNSGSPVELHVLETPYMEIMYTPHGEIEGFIQRGEQGDVVFFPVDDIVYLKFNPVSSAVWGEVGIKSLYRTIATKNFIEQFLNHLASTNAWRQVMKTKMTDDNVQEFLAYFYSQAENPEELLVLHSNSVDDVDKDTKFSILRDPSDLKEFLGTLDYLRTQVLMQLKVPPIMIGLPDSSNRSNSDMQYKAFNIANQSFRMVFSDGMKELFSKLGLGTVSFSWNPIDDRSEKDDVEIAERLMNMGAEPMMVEAFLRQSGLELPEGKLFKPREEVVSSKSEDMFPSRQRKADGESNERIGSGQDGTTREDQL